MCKVITSFITYRYWD